MKRVIHTPEQIAERMAIYEAEMKPLTDQIHEICEKHGFQAILACQYATAEDGFHIAGMSYIEAGVACTDLFHAYNLMQSTMPRELVALEILQGNGHSGDSDESETETDQKVEEVQK